MNTREFCEQIGLKPSTLYQYMYMGVINRPKRMVHEGKMGRPSYDWTNADVTKAKKALGRRNGNWGGKRKAKVAKKSGKVRRRVHAPRKKAAAR